MHIHPFILGGIQKFTRLADCAVAETG